ncbi:FAD:protein FMN transferase [Maribacter sp. HTCC2170]|uniref:FAD:protein FMN transferase n=1 Tax=Maribacter sp. (strain HTCC2170 / KCCM 42371) TaxID=313603 RepID=UPI00006B1B0A|nr:FAD:protein FMN transferase [Maribacter sp. HTCC2170]EAR00740.1 thiamine biosynthesis lipoprotein ApbE precursor [Maribacter sp. HTCC2170]
MTDSLNFRVKGVFVLLILIAISCKSGPETYIKNSNTGGALGTSYSIIYLADKKMDLQIQIDSVFNVMNQSLSTYVPSSDISQINQGNSEVHVDYMFQEVFELSKEIYASTDGYFDPTVGSLVNAWGFGPGEKVTMDSTKVDSLMTFVGFDKVLMNESGQVEKESPNVYMDFNAIAKGYAIDRLAKLMDARGIENYLLEVGGELVAKGVNQIKQKPWVVGIDDPQVEQGRRLKKLIELKDMALASSGNYRKFRIDSITGKKYVHTIDPKTGFTKNASTLGVTVLANTCAKADAYATAFMAMELQLVKSTLTEQKDLEAYVIYLDDAGETKEFMTEGFEKVVLD